MDFKISMVEIVWNDYYEFQFLIVHVSEFFKGRKTEFLPGLQKFNCSLNCILCCKNLLQLTIDRFAPLFFGKIIEYSNYSGLWYACKIIRFSLIFFFFCYNRKSLIFCWPWQHNKFWASVYVSHSSLSLNFLFMI